MLEFHRQRWAPPHPPTRSLAVRRSWQPPLYSCAAPPPPRLPLPPPTGAHPPPSSAEDKPVVPLLLDGSIVPFPPPVGAPRHKPRSAQTGRPLPPPAVPPTLVPSELPPLALRPDVLPAPHGPPVEPDDTPPPRRRQRALIGGALAGTVVLGMTLVSLGVFDSSDGSTSTEEVSRTPMETESEVATPSGRTPTGAAPEPRPPTTIGIGDEATTPSDEPVSEPSSPVLVDPTSGSLPLGTAAPVGQRYVVTVTAVDLDATEIILAEDPSNQPPAAGNTYVMVALDVKYTGLVGDAEPYFDLVVGAMDDVGQEFNDIDCIALTPDDMYGLPPIAPGEAVVGTFCLVVPADTTDSLTFFVEENDSIADTRVWWSAP